MAGRIQQIGAKTGLGNGIHHAEPVVNSGVAVNKRSPILGYNHNFKHRGVVFHVQTEDSGVDNPHIFTHLFHGGVILESRKLVYDAEASEPSVKALMQAQHKSIAKGLRQGFYDDKIDLYLAKNADLLPRRTGSQGSSGEQVPVPAQVSSPKQPAGADRTVPSMPIHFEESASRELARAAAGSSSEVGGAAEPGSAAALMAGPTPTVPGKAPGLSRKELAAADTSPVERVGRRSDTVREMPVIAEQFSARKPPRPPPAGKQKVASNIASAAKAAAARPDATQRLASRSVAASSSRPNPPRAQTSAPIVPKGVPRAGGKRAKGIPQTAENVIVSRPAVIVGQAPQSAKPEAAPATAPENEDLFGREVISERSLDEVIMAYLGESDSKGQ